ncbi:MAG: hypothetical protein OK455_09620, partial [Thaumarchaeota archaeon]|nr:hypothetical protein [Nitrososphaerota archaeon]
NSSTVLFDVLGVTTASSSTNTSSAGLSTSTTLTTTTSTVSGGVPNLPYALVAETLTFLLLFGILSYAVVRRLRR